MTLSEIKAVFDGALPEELPELIKAYSGDERTGVKRQIEAAKKRLLAIEKEKERLFKMLSFEREYGDVFSCIAGIDEAGRGPLAGPVVAAAVVLYPGQTFTGLNDSKQLSEKKREELFTQITKEAKAYGVGIVGPERIDEINILQADYEAMRQAVGNLSVTPDLLLNDAVLIPGLPMKQLSIVKGDAKSLSIAAASVIAKVTRDRLMVEMDKLYPAYGFASHKGYGSEAHIAALKSHGPCPIHRKTFITHFVEQV